MKFLLPLVWVISSAVVASSAFADTEVLPMGEVWSCELTSAQQRIYEGNDADKAVAVQMAEVACRNAEPYYLCGPRYATISCIQK